MSISLMSDLENVSEFVSYAREAAVDARFEGSVIHQVELVTEEVVVNIINYAYPDKRGRITAACKKHETFFEIQISDEGNEFNPLAQKDPDVEGDLESKPIGGLGIFLVKQLMDDAVYARVNDRNILTLRKKR